MYKVQDYVSTLYAEMLITKLYGSLGILLTFEKHLHDQILSQRIITINIFVRSARVKQPMISCLINK
jgi:hypothetical protein